MKFRSLLFVTYLISAHNMAAAESWIALGGMGMELDTSSIKSGRDTSRAWIRMVGATPQGQLTTRMLVAAHCGKELLEIERGVMEADWSSRVVEMPDLAPKDRFIQLPVQNSAFNNLYAYLCQ